MTTSLRGQLNDLAATFTAGVLAAIRTASIEDLLAESGTSPRASRAPAAAAPRAARGRRATGRLPRRSAADIGAMIDDIVGLLRQSPKGLRAEAIRASLGLQAKEMPRPLKEAVEAGRIGKSGQKRATTYFLKGGGASRGARAAAPRKAGRAAAKSRKK
jgi:hypothetical protein